MLNVAMKNPSWAKRISVMILFLPRILIPMIYQMRHDVVWQGAIPGFGAALGVDGISCLCKSIASI